VENSGCADQRVWAAVGKRSVKNSCPSTSEAKALTKAKGFIAALKRCATHNQGRRNFLRLPKRVVDAWQLSGGLTVESRQLLGLTHMAGW
jgi:hypothetical protein